MDILPQASCLVAFGVLLFFLGLALSVTAPDPLKQMLQQHGARPASLEEIEMSRSFGERVVTPILRAIAGLIGRLAPQRNVDAMNHLLDVAGNPFDWTAVDFLGLRGLTTIGFGGLVLFYLSLVKATPLIQFLFVVGGFGVGFYLPVYWLRFKARARQSAITKALPDALDLLTISVEAGLGLDSAIQRVTQKWDNELSRAFARVLAEIRVGKLRREALRDMADRLDVPDVSNFIAAVIQAEQLGASITNVLHIQSEQMRVIRRQRAQERAQAAPLKMLIPLVLFIFPSMFIVILGPAALRLLTAGLLSR